MSIRYGQTITLNKWVQPRLRDKEIRGTQEAMRRQCAARGETVLDEWFEPSRNRFGVTEVWCIVIATKEEA